MYMGWCDDDNNGRSGDDNSGRRGGDDNNGKRGGGDPNGGLGWLQNTVEEWQW